MKMQEISVGTNLTQLLFASVTGCLLALCNGAVSLSLVFCWCFCVFLRVRMYGIKTSGRILSVVQLCKQIVNKSLRILSAGVLRVVAKVTQ